jgi:ABC-type Fe3+/spermidine/putrescine transport system ATPase subunit
MPRIELNNISRYVLDDLSLTIEDKEVMALVGPNGAGKSTVLNVIAGLVDYKGEVCFDGKRMDHLPPHRRGIGYLFQDLALFPHLTVAANIAYGLKVQGYDATVCADRVDELAKALHIEKLKGRYPISLSGGEKQRVAIARAVAPFQKILLLDEPTSSLDAQTAKYLRAELGSLLRKFEMTAVFVIHDLLGAEEIADRIAIIHKGRIEQVARPEEIFFSPQTRAVSEFIGVPNILNCEQSHVLSSGLIEVTCGDMRIVLPYEGNPIRKIAIPPHDIYISDTKPPGPTLNRYTGQILEITPLRSIARIKVLIGRNILLAELASDTVDEMNLAVGQQVHVIVKLRRLRYFEAEDNSTIVTTCP